LKASRYRLTHRNFGRVLFPGCFAYHYVGADIINGGISQLYGYSTWSLILTAIKACQQAKAGEEERLLKEIVLYYHQKGRSRLEKQLPENSFDDIKQPMEKSLSQLEDEYYALNQYNVPSLLNDESLC
jgi:predicted acyl esterase